MKKTSWCIYMALFVGLFPFLLSAQGGDQAMGVARTFVGTPYKSGTLEQPGPEHLVTNTKAMDCWTFVDQSVAICVARQEHSDWRSILRKMRYRSGLIDGYGSRIHYFLEWAMQAEQYGILKNITTELGGIPYRKTVSFMSRYPEKYPRLEDEKALEAVQAAENRINARSWTFIPQDKISAVEHLLREGDIIATTAKHPYLDVTHQGFVVFKNERPHLLHASSRAGKVVVSSKPLSDYVLDNKDQTGIIVLRMAKG